MKSKQIIIGVIIAIMVFPAIALGGTFTASLISGKTTEEAIQILANQIDILIGRIEKIENRQTEVENEQVKIKEDQIEQIGKFSEVESSIIDQKQIIIDQQAIIDQLKQEQTEQQSRIDNEKLCREADRLYRYIPTEPVPAPQGWYRIMSSANNIEELYNTEKNDQNNPDFVQLISPAYNEYIIAKSKCK